VGFTSPKKVSRSSTRTDLRSKCYTRRWDPQKVGSTGQYEVALATLLAYPLLHGAICVDANELDTELHQPKHRAQRAGHILMAISLCSGAGSNVQECVEFC
jgi:hypothetical protein